MNTKRRSSQPNTDEPAIKRKADAQPEGEISKKEKKRIPAMTDNLWYLPEIIREIFKNLKWFDIENCSLVCKTWQEEAARFLDPPIDDCSIVAKDVACELECLRSKRKYSKTRNKVFSELEKQNLKTSYQPTGSFTNEPHYLWYFFYRGDDLVPSMRTNLDQYLRDFLNKKTKYAPSFTFIRSDYRFKSIREIFAPECPTVILQHKTLRIPHKKEFQIFQTLSDVVGIPGLFESLKHEKRNRRASECLKAFHINQEASDHKVIATDWSVPRCAGPTLDDPQYPIKAFIYLYGAGFGLKEPMKIQNWLDKCSLQASGIQLDYDSEIFYGLNSDGFRTTAGLSISFCGKEVESAIVDLKFKFRRGNKKDVDKIIYQALQSKEKPNFPVDDGRVLGFIFESSKGWHDALDRIFEIFSKSYPRVKFVRIHSRATDFQGFRGFQSVRIHLIRI